MTAAVGENETQFLLVILGLVETKEKCVNTVILI